MTSLMDAPSLSLRAHAGLTIGCLYDSCGGKSNRLEVDIPTTHAEAASKTLEVDAVVSYSGAWRIGCLVLGLTSWLVG